MTDMLDHETETDFASEISVDETPRDPSILDQLAAAREEIAENKTVELDIPGYNGRLVAVYHLLEVEEMTKLAKRVNKQYKKTEERALAISCDLLLNACDGLYHRNDEGDLLSINKDGEQLNFHNAGDFLKFEANSARQSVIAVFGDNEQAVLEQQARLSRWMRNTSVDVNSDFLGEF